MRNYKSHINNKRYTCNIVRHFIDKCSDNENPSRYLGFIIVDVLENAAGMAPEEVDDLLLQKEKFWIGALITQHSGMNCSHDWNRSRRSEKAPTSNLASDP